jgi:hypothetical protein
MPVRHAEWRVRSNQVVKFSSYTRRNSAHPQRLFWRVITPVTQQHLINESEGRRPAPVNTAPVVMNNPRSIPAPKHPP